LTDIVARRIVGKRIHVLFTAYVSDYVVEFKGAVIGGNGAVAVGDGVGGGDCGHQFIFDQSLNGLQDCALHRTRENGCIVLRKTICGWL
jgi:hypothetical protein